VTQDTLIPIETLTLINHHGSLILHKNGVFMNYSMLPAILVTMGRMVYIVA
jgi:hypothetical protein